ncbi:hypothetical protein WOLCODRAFT_16004 [Wolfiporia cocos MD-104 SS10]|uniref:Uncharacterized protein n=1 Tax=Wolfiporia cocos (strain MD-104) TaxID=742152 RepID=A0A2H3J8Y6_WOLCO|nr:hypothetical protein WOLCODRAFT_16004 [Wolfiporia cocos MD-104 SS10]
MSSCSNPPRCILVIQLMDQSLLLFYEALINLQAYLLAVFAMSQTAVQWYNPIDSHPWISLNDAPPPVPVSNDSEIACGNPLSIGETVHHKRQRLPQCIYTPQNTQGQLHQKIPITMNGRPGIFISRIFGGHLHIPGHHSLRVLRTIIAVKRHPLELWTQWPGYEEYAKQFNIKSMSDGHAIPITLNTLIQKIARKTRHFLEVHPMCGPDSVVLKYPYWNVGVDNIWFDQLYFVELLVVSRVQLIFDVITT